MVRFLLPILLLAGGCITGGEVFVIEQPVLPKSNHSHFVYIDEIETDPYPAVVTVLYEGILVGTGVLIGPDTVLTAGHIVDCTGEYTIICSGVEHCVQSIIMHPRFHPYKNIFIDYIEVDLAIVKLETPSDVTPIKLMEKTHIVGYGEALEIIGHGTGRKRYCNDSSFWYFGRLIESPWNIVMLPTHETIWFGDSGGAIIDDNDNVLIGIASAIGRRHQIISHNIGSWVGSELDWIIENL